jgi:hypothetical protein
MMNFREYVARSFKSEQMKRQLQELTSVLIDLFSVPRSAQGVRAAMHKESRLPKAHDSTEAVWRDPRSPLYDWLEKQNVKVHRGHVPPFAQGGAGRAYFLGDKVVKMSANRVEANVASMVAGRTDVPTPVIAVTYLGPNLYAILQHFVDTNVPDQIKKAADYLTATIDDHPEMQGFPMDKADQEWICKDTLLRHKADMKLLPYMIMMMGVLATLYGATGFKHDDAGPTNVAMHQGKVVIPDLGPNEDGDFDQLSALANIQKNRQALGLAKHKPI